MINLFSLQSKTALAIGGIFLIAGMYLYGYFAGLSVGREELAIYKLTVKAVGDAQEAKTKQVIISQQQLANEANDEATKLRDALSNYFNDPRVHVEYGSGQRKLPPVPNAPRRIDETTSERKVNPPVSEAKECIPVVPAAQDAMTILLWQKWAKENIELRR